MVANSPPEPSADTFAALVQRLDAIQRQLDEAGRAAKAPFIVSHNGSQDFAITPSPTGDGTMDILIGDGAGGKLMQIKTDPSYGTKILQFLDQAGNTMMSTDAKAGYGWGTPSYPFTNSGYTWSQTLAGATNQATAKEIGRGMNYVYNPATYIKPIIRIASPTAETVKVFCQWRDFQGNLNSTSDQTLTVTAGGVTIDANTCQFGKLWQADDMNGQCLAFIKAWVLGGTPGNVTIQMTAGEGYGVSQGFYDLYSAGWAV